MGLEVSATDVAAAEISASEVAAPAKVEAAAGIAPEVEPAGIVAEAEATVAQYTAKGVACHYIESEGKFLVFRDADHKTLKSIHYSPADLEGILAVNQT